MVFKYSIPVVVFLFLYLGISGLAQSTDAPKSELFQNHKSDFSNDSLRKSVRKPVSDTINNAFFIFSSGSNAKKASLEKISADSSSTLLYNRSDKGIIKNR